MTTSDRPQTDHLEQKLQRNAAALAEQRLHLNRRRFLALLGSVGALGAVGCSSTPKLQPTVTSASASTVSALGAQAGADPEAAATDIALPRQAHPRRTLVVVELQGGNDGLAMLQPMGEGLLHDARPELVTADAELLRAADGFGWHPALAGLHERGIAAVVGIGSNEPDFSHFEMEQRWWRGDSAERSHLATGFFGRLCDQLDAGAPVTGLSVSGGPSPALRSERAVTVGLNDPGSGWFFREDDPWLDAFGSAIVAMTEPSASDGVSQAAAREGLGNLTSFSAALAQLEQGENERYPWTDLGQQLRFASDVMQLDLGIRVIHTRLGGFDTHTGQQWRQAALMEELNAAVSAFVDDLADRGQLDETLVVTTSEFGRRVPQNDGGTDHGGASTMLVCGGGASGVHGDPPDLGSLDDGNVVATARFEDYYATIAESWFGVDHDQVLPSGGDVIPELLAV